MHSKILLIAMLFLGASASYSATTQEVISQAFDTDGVVQTSCDAAEAAAVDAAEATQATSDYSCQVTTRVTWIPEPDVPPFGSCVEVIGFSQTDQWASFVSFPINQRTFQGAGIDTVWANSGDNRWFRQSISQRACDDEDVTTVVLNVSSRNITTPEDFEHYTRLAVQNALDGRRPSLTALFLQPVVGPPEGTTTCGNSGSRATTNFPNIIAAIDVVASEFTQVYHVHSPRVGDCSHYTDQPGHISSAGGAFVAGEFEAAYDQAN